MQFVVHIRFRVRRGVKLSAPLRPPLVVLIHVSFPGDQPPLTAQSGLFSPAKPLFHLLDLWILSLGSPEEVTIKLISRD